VPLPSAAQQNIELKARLASLEQAADTAKRIGATWHAVEDQCDTYFHCRTGRLKLREIDSNAAQLIWYARPNESGPKSSDYCLYPVDQPQDLKELLTSALGVRAVVEKRRIIYLFKNVRIHLDEVRGLGTFLEFEAVLGPGHDQAEGRRLVDQLQSEFGIEPDDLLTRSYGEMVLDAC
jgi:predicted adenylyl cyclase CyaB